MCINLKYLGTYPSILYDYYISPNTTESDKFLVKDSVIILMREK